MNQWRVPLFDLEYGAEERNAVLAVLDSKWLTMGPKTEEFEHAFEKFLGGEVRCTAVANGTAALHLALMAHGIGPRDEVIVSALSFVAALNVVTITGATPVLADCASLHDWNVSVEQVEAAITERTKAAVLVHFAGYPFAADRLRDTLRKRGIALIEDAAHAVGASLNGQMCGAMGDVGCFSFFSNKNLSTGEGGMLATRDPQLQSLFQKLRSHGMSSMTVERHQGRAISYDVTAAGLNYRIDEMRSALGVVQLGKLNDANRRRGALVHEYGRLLTESGCVVPFLPVEDHLRPSYHIFPVLLPEGTDRVAVVSALREEGIQTSLHYPAYQGFTRYSVGLAGKAPVSRQISERVLTLPLYPGMNVAAVATVCECLRRALGE